MRTMAAPILNAKGELVAGLSVAGPAYRINKKKINSCATLVMQYAQRISTHLEPILLGDYANDFSSQDSFLNHSFKKERIYNKRRKNE